MNTSPAILTVLAFSVVYAQSAAAQTPAQLNCTQGSSAETAAIFLNDSNQARVGVKNSYFPDASPDFQGTYVTGLQGSHTRVPEETLVVQAKAPISHTSDNESITISLTSMDLGYSYSGTLTLKNKGGEVILQSPLSCQAGPDEASGDPADTMPMPPHRCGRCAI